MLNPKFLIPSLPPLHLAAVATLLSSATLSCHASSRPITSPAMKEQWPAGRGWPPSCGGRRARGHGQAAGKKQRSAQGMTRAGPEIFGAWSEVKPEAL